MPYFLFCLDLTFETWAKATCSHYMYRFVTQKTTLTHYWSFNSNEWSPSRLKPPTIPGMEPLQGESRVSETPLCKKEEEWPTQWQPTPFYIQVWQPPWAVTTNSFLHPSMTTTMGCDVRVKPTHLPLSHPLEPLSTAQCWCEQKWVELTPCRSLYIMGRLIAW